MKTSENTSSDQLAFCFYDLLEETIYVQQLTSCLQKKSKKYLQYKTWYLFIV